MTQDEPFLELDGSIDETAARWRAKARAFAAEHAAPIGRRLDVMSAQEAVASGSPYFDFLGAATAAGFLTMTAPAAYGGPGLSRLAEYLVVEELATGDAGLATSLFIAPMAYRYAHDFGSPRLVEELSRPYFTGQRPEWSSCFAITDAGHGSDMMASHTPAFAVPGGDVIARRDGDEWVLDGTKAAWTSNAMTATHALVCCTIDRTSLARGGIAVVPLDVDGVTRGRPLDKHGLRSLNQGSLSFSAVRLPADHLLIGEDAYATAMQATHALASVSMALLAFGTARAAYEGALRWVRERVQGGRILSEHQATQLRIFRMFGKLEAARALTRAVFLHNYGRTDAGGMGSLAHAAAAKVFVTEAAVEICGIAFQLCGARATQRDGVRFTDGSVFYPEKLLRDARSFMVADGENDLLSLLGAAHLL
ncbi:acyl-CoA dehydrogenase [Actinoplanes sp. NBRC 14428]|uniref:Alkylation response protein AidB-like acyl-CoA dehydrogenase n=1 Tax=Pseudosporangium ferrugineum TaxID=439699 RepID=A0A2T0SJF3_9ACTN|nr:acyl-CoA dehydrogenase family protein [Pseudosporangium ferrugineum]PRY33546.1 alkylation response protein AidB-like acyl-CoA dehydrogenase [Pseudosporangium ferrugineum]BCJ56504.1 acyl-CoA dehydrogenase [Actinoplanes sp. NBRC 14428]